MTEIHVIEHRKLLLVNTDPQRRCYHGVHAKSELQWTAWSTLATWPVRDVAERRLEFWRGLAAYAAKERGAGTTTEYRVRRA